MTVETIPAAELAARVADALAIDVDRIEVRARGLGQRCRRVIFDVDAVEAGPGPRSITVHGYEQTPSRGGIVRRALEVDRADVVELTITGPAAGNPPD